MKFMLIFVLIISSFSMEFEDKHFKIRNNENNYTILHNDYYISIYNNLYKHPDFVVYEVNGALAKKVDSSSRPSWRIDRRIKKEYRSYSRDYRKTGYDRGHNVPNAVMDFSKDSRKSTFLMSNVTPQARSMNRTIWRKIERSERILSILYERAEVVTGSCINHKDKKLYIPMYWFKIILIPSKKVVLYFLIENKNEINGIKVSHLKIKDALVKKKEIEETCNMKIVIKGLK